MNLITIVEAVFGVLILVGWCLNYILARELRKLADALLELVRNKLA